MNLYIFFINKIIFLEELTFFFLSYVRVTGIFVVFISSKRRLTFAITVFNFFVFAVFDLGRCSLKTMFAKCEIAWHVKLLSRVFFVALGWRVQRRVAGLWLDLPKHVCLLHCVCIRKILRKLKLLGFLREGRRDSAHSITKWFFLGGTVNFYFISSYFYFCWKAWNSLSYSCFYLERWINKWYKC